MNQTIKELRQARAIIKAIMDHGLRMQDALNADYFLERTKYLEKCQGCGCVRDLTPVCQSCIIELNILREKSNFDT